MKFHTNLKLVLTAVLLSATAMSSAQTNPNYLSFDNAKTLHDYFRYTDGNDIIVSGHRGGQERGFPENSIEGFQNVLNQIPAFFEIDPRLTKDSVIVLMHDATLDRTTTAKGKLSDYTWAELQDVRLKDAEGNVTDCKTPTLEDAIKWSKGKTLLDLDKKDVPLDMIVDIIKKHNAENHVILTIHTGAQAAYYHKRLPNIMFSVFARNDKEMEDIVLSEVPWENMMAYIGASINDTNRHIVEKLHSHGVRCMISLAPTADKEQDKQKRFELYREAIAEQPDIIESDLPVDVWKVIHEK